MLRRGPERAGTVQNNSDIWELWPAGELDLPRILEIDRESITPPWTELDMQSELGRADSTFIAAAEYGGVSVVGFIILRRVSIDEGEIFRIAVAKSARRRGVGDMLMRMILNYADNIALKTLYLEVRESNKAAITLYRKYGFVQSGRRKGYYDNPTEDATIMTRTTP